MTMRHQHQNIRAGEPRIVFKRRLGKTLLSWFLALTLIPMAAAGVVSYRNARESLYKGVETALVLGAASKTESIHFYFSKMLADLKLQAELRTNRRFLEALLGALEESGGSAVDFKQSETRAAIVEEHGADLKRLRAAFGHHDILLMDRDGVLLFTAAEEETPGANLFAGRRAETRFARACKKTLETGLPVFSDYQEHTPSNGRVFGYVSAVVPDRAGREIGLIAFQFTIDPIDKIMRTRMKLGQAAETYLIGSDLRMRSNSILAGEKTVLRGRVETEQTRLWRRCVEKGVDASGSGETAFIYNGPHGKPVLGVHEDIVVGGVALGVIAEIEKEEAFAPAASLRDAMLALLSGAALVVALLAFFVSRRIVGPIQDLSSGAKRAADGRLDQEFGITLGNEIGELADSFNNMLHNMRTTMEKNEAQNRLKTGLGELNEKMRGELDAGALGANIIGFLSEYLDARIGALYMAREDGALHLIGSYAWTFRKRISNLYAPGEGLVGQAALEKKHILLSQCPEDYVLIQSGLGDARPKNILVHPLMLDDAVKGVVEFGSFNEFSDFHLDFLESVAEGVAISLNSLQSRVRMTELLEKTRQQAEELRTREEELRESNNELMEQTRALRKSETRLRDQQEELQQVNDELGEQAQLLETQKSDIEKKNRDLKNAQAIVEEKANDLEMSSKYKSEFLANMSHELRTPLNSVLLLSRLLTDNKEGNLTTDQMESVASIHSSGADLLELINDVLDLSKVESGKMKLVIEEMNLAELSRAMERNFKPLANEKGLNLTLSMGEDLPETIRTDRQRVDQIMKNFLSNAFKFTMEGGVTLLIDSPNQETSLLESEFDPAEYISLAVIDTGLGVPKDKQKLIFEAFQQVDGSTSRTFGGTGLGLSISREFAGLLGGEIRLESRPGQGSTFVLYLPRKRREEPEAPASRGGASRWRTAPRGLGFSPGDQEDKNGEPLSPGTHSPEKIMDAIGDDRRNLKPGDKSVLIIEDDPAFAAVLKKLAYKHGFKCIIADDGKTGLQFADYYNPGAIILDIGLPGMNGWTVMARLKENSNTRHIPVHFITVSEKKPEAMKMGAADFATKPVSPETIDLVYERLDRIISKPVKDLLIVESDHARQKSIETLLAAGDVRISLAAAAGEARAKLETGTFDCMVLNPALPDMSGIRFLEAVRDNENDFHMPIVVYTEKAPTKEERAAMDKYAESNIVKGANSHQMLLGETVLFLHRVETSLSDEQRAILRKIHDKEAILDGKMVLVVDDDMRNVFSLKKILEDKGIRVLVGKNGRDGLKRLHDQPEVKLVLMDIMMPEMNGYEAMAEIRKQERYRDLPIIALTAKAMRGDRRKCIEAGASDYLAKPVDADRLFSMLRVWMYE